LPNLLLIAEQDASEDEVVSALACGSCISWCPCGELLEELRSVKDTPHPECHSVLHDRLVLVNELLLLNDLADKPDEITLESSEVSVVQNISSKLLEHQSVETVV
jgi:hypothetical protein